MVSGKEAPELGEHLEEVLGSEEDMPYLSWEMFSQVIRGLQKLGYLLVHTLEEHRKGGYAQGTV